MHSFSVVQFIKWLKRADGAGGGEEEPVTTNTPHILLNIPQWEEDVKQTDQPQSYTSVFIQEKTLYCDRFHCNLFLTERALGLELLSKWEIYEFL